MSNQYIKWFSEIGITDVATVGGKNASLGEMYNSLSAKGINVPNGFATTAFAFEEYLTFNKLFLPLRDLMRELDHQSYSNLKEIGKKARDILSGGTLPKDLELAISHAYNELCNAGAQDVAVRSSATAEDLPQASFAGQHESFLHIRGEGQVLSAVKKCFVSLYTDRAIKYREDNAFAHEKVLLSAGVQKMVRADKACAGVGFTLEPESGFDNIIHLSGVWGLGENLVQGTVTPDEFFVFKPSLIMGKYPIVQKRLGDKSTMLVYGKDQKNALVNIPTLPEQRSRYVLSDDEVITLAGWALTIERHYGKPMDIEWAKDGIDGKIYIVQARPETVHSRKNVSVLRDYQLTGKGNEIVRGEAVGSSIMVGVARILASVKESGRLLPGEIVVTDTTTPDWDPILKKAGAIVTDKGGRTSHASIVARELGVPAIVGCGDATGRIRDGELITVSCCEGRTGFVYQGKTEFRETIYDLSQVPKPKNTAVMLITGDPAQAFRLSSFPCDGVGLLRIEFIIARTIRVHPMALVRFDTITENGVIEQIQRLTAGYADKRDYFTDKLAEGIATIASAFYPRDVIVRMSDFKTNEYANLLGGSLFEPKEENPMIGFRGASRYYHERYKEGFELECRSIIKVRETMGLTNVKVMIPFCRTTGEAKRVLDTMKGFGLERGKNGLQVYVMAEIPSNVILASKFARLFDGFSIGSNDLTQLTLGIDRDSAIIHDLFDEQDEAAMEMIATVIRRAKDAGVRIGLCGQAPSDFPVFARFLVEQGIDSISFNSDALLKGVENICEAEKKPSAEIRLAQDHYEAIS
jgi:pyruvate,water dikinase